ncbi:MAG TPA: site-specific DNA-methyltransferase [Geminicoccaceae bacterium]|nr:site-specific DNA-methyltransferase [Geminicoccus sp.]HMU50114.1 site-specific DNA-methyltransferase [Geminicoccaceae bacterium]
MAKKEIGVEALTHVAANRKNIPTAELESVMRPEQKSPLRVAYERRNRDLDPQLVWRGKDEQDWSDLVVPAPPLYIQEKVHPKALIEDLRHQSRRRREEASPAPDLFADFNGLPDIEARTEFYQHDAHWSNRMILGDSLSVMASLAEREGLRGKVQCIYIDPPYGIKFNSNFQWSTTSRDVKDGSKDHITREPEQVRAFRDTWRDGIHSYLTYLCDRLTVARDLLHESGSIFVQIGDENGHRVRALMDEIFGPQNACAQITVVKTAGQTSELIAGTADYILWYSRSRSLAKFRVPLVTKNLDSDKSGVYRWIRGEDGSSRLLSDAERAENRTAGVYRLDNLTSQRPPGSFPVTIDGRIFGSRKGYWKTGEHGMARLIRASRIGQAKNSLTYVRFLDDFIAQAVSNVWNDTGTGSFTDEKIYVVQSGTKAVQRCVLMATDPGDLVLDPTCGSGTSAYVAEQWGRRWITIDTSRVALALARSRLMGARYSYYLLADSPEGQTKEAEVTRTAPRTTPTRGDIRQGFVYERVPHVTLKSIANNAEIDVIWESWQPKVVEALAQLNTALKGHGTPFKITTGGRSGKEVNFRAADGVAVKLPSGEDSPAGALLDWEVPREAPADWPEAAAEPLAAFWEARIARQKEIDASIAAKAEFEYLYDKPYVDNARVRVAGPFTVESLSPHRLLAFDAEDGLVDPLEASERRRASTDRETGVRDFAQSILENLRTAGVQQAHKEDRIAFTSLTGWPGKQVCAEGRFLEGETERRAAIMIGPEFGTVARPDLMAAAREAGDAGFDVLIACAFSFDARSAEVEKLGRVRILKARMNPDLHMATDLKATAAGNLFVIFGEPDIAIEDAGEDQVRVRIRGVDVFKPQTGEVVSEGPEGIALWMIDTDYDEESFFVRHAYFLGANDPYKALKTTLKAEIDEEAWSSLNSEVSRPFAKPSTGRIAVKVINHLGDEAMKVFGVA